MDTDEFKGISALHIANSLRTAQSLYTGNRDTDRLEWLSNSIRHNGVRILLAMDGRLRTSYEATKLPWFQGLIDQITEDGWLMYNHGYVERVIKTLPDKMFFQIRSWLVGGALPAKMPSFLTSLEALYGRGIYLDDEHLFDLNTDSQYTAQIHLLKADRLFDLIHKSERLRVVSYGNFRTSIENILGWHFKVVNSIGEHHFEWDKETEMVVCKTLNGTVAKSYGIGKALKRIAIMMEQPEPSTESIKTISQWLKNFGTGTFEVVGGEDIAEYYMDGRMFRAGNVGTMADGCMRHESMREALDNIYNGNASMLILRSNEDKTKIIGRANLWTTDKGVLFMERIYSGEDNIVLFKKWAKDNGYIYKKRQSYGMPMSVINLKGDEQILKMDITLSNYETFWDNDRDGIEVPYMDTFKYLDMECGRLINYAPDQGESGIWYQLENTSGTAQRVDTDYGLDYRDY